MYVIIKYSVESFLESQTFDDLEEAKKAAKDLSVKNGEARITKWVFPPRRDDYMDWDEAECDPYFEVEYKNGKELEC